jgi:hypothetical protein
MTAPEKYDHSRVGQKEHNKWHYVVDIRTWWLVCLLNMAIYVMYRVA